MTGHFFDLHVMSRAKLVGVYSPSSCVGKLLDVYYDDVSSSDDDEGAVRENGGTSSGGSATMASKKSRSRRNSCLARRQVHV